MTILPISILDDRTRLQHAMRTLQLAGLQGELDQGVTDEGDAWAILYRPNGDVVLHLAVVGGQIIFVDEATMTQGRTV